MTVEAVSIAATHDYSWTEQLPVLQVVVPLIAAPICSLLRGRNLPWALALGVSAFAFVCSVMLLIQVREVGIISYPLGGWLPPFGIEFRVDVVNAFVLVIVSAISLIVLPFAKKSPVSHMGPTISAVIMSALFFFKGRIP